jgi:anti-sigma B factor antagonist
LERAVSSAETTRSQAEPVQLARVGERLFVIRIDGRGSFQNCGGLKQFLDRQLDAAPDTELIVDLQECTSMDSTFMGVLAGAGLRQRQTGRGRLVITNLKPHTAKLLKTLGLTHFLDVRLDGPTPSAAAKAENFQTLPEVPPMSRLERIRMMIEAHERLVDIDKGNEVKFQGVLTYLAESLQKAERQSGREGGD